MAVAITPNRVQGKFLTAAVEKVTPHDAERWLSRNSHNRTLRQFTVGRFAGAMQRGEWALNGESIKFNADGLLLDGQHRLAAIVESGVTIHSLVVRGLPDIAQDTVDIGIRRSAGDILRLHGYTDTNVLGAAVTFLYRMFTHQWYSGKSYQPPTPQEILRLLNEHPRITESVVFGGRLGRRVRISRSLATAIHYRFSQIDPIDADAFFDRLTTGENLQAGNPIYALRRWLEQTGAISKSATPAVVYAVTVKAWNAYRRNEDLALVRFRRGLEQWPEPE